MKYFVTLRILYPFIKSFLDDFVDISLTSPDRSSRFFSTCKYFALFEVILLFMFIRYLSKYVFSAKSEISSLVANFACFNLASKLSAVDLLNSLVVLSMS